METPLVRFDNIDREIALTESEVTLDNPDVDGELIRTLVRGSYARLTPAKVHGYLPILVVRDVNHRLHDLAVS